jgi:hypothetical protein
VGFRTKTGQNAGMSKYHENVEKNEELVSTDKVELVSLEEVTHDLAKKEKAN